MSRASVLRVGFASVLAILSVPDLWAAGPSGCVRDFCADPTRDCDGDRVQNGDDNCPCTFNPGQTDEDGDGTGDACWVCSIMEPAAGFAFQTSEGMSWKLSGGYYRSHPVGIFSDVCARTVKGVAGDIDLDLVATEPRRTAVSLRRSRGAYYEDPSVGGWVITGGGRAQIDPYFVWGSIDTSGTHPDVEKCQRSQAAAVVASRHFASLPARRTLPDVVVRDDEYPIEDHILDVREGGVFDIDNLTVAGRHGYYTCETYGTLYVDVDPEKSVVINVRKRLQLGQCGFIETWESDIDNIVINVVGRGAVKLGRASGMNVPLLAPERTVSVKGADNYEEPQWMEPTWVRKLGMVGYVYANLLEYRNRLDYQYCGVTASAHD